MNIGGIRISSANFRGVTVASVGFTADDDELEKYFDYVCEHAPDDDVKNLESIAVTQNFNYGRDNFIDISYTVRKPNAFTVERGDTQ